MGITYRHVSKQNEDLKQNSDDIEKEQAYQLSKWLEHERRIKQYEKYLINYLNSSINIIQQTGH